MCCGQTYDLTRSRRSTRVLAVLPSLPLSLSLSTPLSSLSSSSSSYLLSFLHCLCTPALIETPPMDLWNRHVLTAFSQVLDPLVMRSGKLDSTDGIHKVQQPNGNSRFSSGVSEGDARHHDSAARGEINSGETGGRTHPNQETILLHQQVLTRD